MITTFIQLFKVEQSSLKPSLENVLVGKLNHAVSESDVENSSQYFEVDDFKKTFNSSNHKGTNFFHMNIFSLSYNFG